MTILLALAALAALQTAPAPAWTWTLYDGEGPLVLAEEVPDSPDLRNTLECEAGSGRVSLTLYDANPNGGFVTVRSGPGSATAQVEPAHSGKTDVALRTDLPVFAAFTASGEMTVALGEQDRRISVGRGHLAKLRRFAERCAG